MTLTMLCRTVFARQVLALAIAVASLSSVAVAQDKTVSRPRIYAESFDTGDPTVMLGGQIGFGTEVPPWGMHIADGKLVLENRVTGPSIHYSDIAWVKYPDSDVLQTTEGSVISAVVEAKNVGSGGVGILVGSGKAGVYIAFLVDAQGQYHVIGKDGREVRRLHSGKDSAILAGAPNNLAFQRRNDNVVFLSNGVEIIKIPYIAPPEGSGQGGVGIAAFGIGAFSFDSVEIARTE
jgi:hypothetical protein